LRVLVNTDSERRHLGTVLENVLHKDVQPLPVKGNASVPEASKMTLFRQLLAHDSLESHG
jgi:hypothetical protein